MGDIASAARVVHRTVYGHFPSRLDADSDLSNGTLGARAATITSLLMLGVPETRAIPLLGDHP